MTCSVATNDPNERSHQKQLAMPPEKEASLVSFPVADPRTRELPIPQKRRRGWDNPDAVGVKRGQTSEPLTTTVPKIKSLKRMIRHPKIKPYQDNLRQKTKTWIYDEYLKSCPNQQIVLTGHQKQSSLRSPNKNSVKNFSKKGPRKRLAGRLGLARNIRKQPTNNQNPPWRPSPRSPGPYQLSPQMRSKQKRENSS